MRLSSCVVVLLLDHLPMKSNYVHILANCYFIGRGGWGVENCRIRPNTAQFQLKLPTGAELGNKNNYYYY